MVPKIPGTYNIQPKLTYFRPDSVKYITAATENIQVRVAKGNNPIDTKPTETITGTKDIKHIRQGPGRIFSPSRFAGSPLYWALLALPAILFLVWMIIKRIRDNRPDIDPVAEKARLAMKMAEQRLSTAKVHLEKGENRPFYDEISKALLGYVSDKFNIPGSELSKSNVEEKLKESGADEGHVKRFMELIRKCEMAVFGLASSGDAQGVYQEAAKVIADIEQG